MAPTPELPYRLGRTERRGTVLGFRPGQAGAVAVGAAACVLTFGADGAAGVVLAVAFLAAGIAVAAVPVAGRGIDEWAPVVASHLVGPRRAALAPGCAVVEFDGTACLRWPDDTATVVCEWAYRGLRALGDEPRAHGESVAAWLRGLGAPGAVACSVTLLTVTGPSALVAAAPYVDPGVDALACIAVTADTPARAASVLLTSGVTGLRTFDADELRALLARRVAPAEGTVLDCDVRARWHLLEGPASVHAAFVVEEWPTGALDEQALVALCVSRDRRAVAVSLRIEELHRARQRTARSRTAAAADGALAASGGFLASAESARDEARDAERAAELAAGHGSVRMVGAVSIDANDELALEAAAARLLADAASCGVRLRRCDGDHRRGVLATVPGWCWP